MIIDKSLLFSEGQTVSATAASTAIDVGKGDLGASPMELVVTVGADAAGAGSLVVSLESSDTTAAGDFTALVSSRSLTSVDLKAGASVLPIQVPRGAKRYLRLNYVVTGVLSVPLTAFLTYDRARG